MISDPAKLLRALDPERSCTAPPIDRLWVRLEAEGVLTAGEGSGADRAAKVPELDESERGERTRQGRPSREWASGAILAGLVTVTVAIMLAALVLLRSAPKPAPTNKPTGVTTTQRLVDILGVLRRPQTSADRALPDRVRGAANPILAANTGIPDLRLARLATITPWGQKVFIAPMEPLSHTEIVALEHRHPGLERLFEHRPVQTVTLGLFGSQEDSFGSVADIEAGKESAYDGTNSILGLDGPGPPIRVLMVIPDGVAKVTFVLPRQAYPGAIVYPAPETITVPVHDNIAAFETNRYIDQDHWTRIPMTWFAPSGAVVKRLGDFGQLNTVLPDPELDAAVRTKNASTWDSVTVVPRAGNQSTTFTVAFRRPVSGAYHYTFRFSGPTPHAGCYSPVSLTPINRGPDLGIPSSRVGQIASTQFPAQSWCPGTYHVRVAVASDRPFSTASFTVGH